MSSDCLKCKNEQNTSIQCGNCLQPSLDCAVCLLPIRGLAMTCEKCQHVGHFGHIKKWFKNVKKCPVPYCDCICYNGSD